MIRSAIYFLVQFGVFDFLLSLIFQAPLKEDEVEWQAEPKQGHCQQSNIHLLLQKERTKPDVKPLVRTLSP